MKRRTQDEFISLAKTKHNNKYSYQNTLYVSAHVSILVTCPKHGDFQVTANQHLKGNGCPKCVGRGRTTEEFVSISKDIHSNKYDYSLCEYVNTEEKVKIICPKHGQFEQTPKAHMNGHGCDKCGGTSLYSTEEFIYKAKMVHGDTYDYSKTVYINSKTKLTVTCPKHGDFEQNGNSHLLGQGCPSCGGTKKLTTESFVARANKIHNGKYCYNKTKYKNNLTKITITCPVHGDFEQLPGNHLNSGGCLSCSPVKPHSDESIRFRFRETHGNTYNYDKVIYKSINSKVIITCPNHGDFKQTPKMHINGSGCPSCAVTGYDPNAEKGWFYIVTFGDFVGFGISNFIVKRLQRHETNTAKANFNMLLCKTYEMSAREALNLETNVKRHFKSYIVDTGVEGFKAESMFVSEKQNLLDFCDSLTFSDPCDTHPR